jgi:hypothetical protein
MRLSRPIQKVFDLLLAELRSIGDRLQQLTRTVEEQNTAERKRNQPPPVLRAELEVPQAIRDQKAAQDTRNNRRENWRLAVEIITVLIVLGYTSVAYLQWTEFIGSTDAAFDSAKAARRSAAVAAENAQIASEAVAENKREFSSTLKELSRQTKAQTETANAAKSAADIARDALKRSQRPWVGVVGVPTITEFSVGLDQTGHRTVNGKIAYTITNYGTSPALFVNTDARPDWLKFQFQGWKTQEWLVAQPMKSACWFAEQSTAEREIIGLSTKKPEKFTANPRGYTIFPTQQFATVDSTNVSWGQKPSDVDDKPLYIFGCIAYGDQFAKTIHHTRYCYMIPAPISGFTAGKPPLSCPISTNAD